jgi:hypothetical protein
MTDVPDKVASTSPSPRQGIVHHAPYGSNACILRQRASKRLLQVSIDSYLVLSWNRTPRKSQKFSFRETRKVLFEYPQIVATIKQVKCCKGKQPRKQNFAISSQAIIDISSDVADRH